MNEDGMIGHIVTLFPRSTSKKILEIFVSMFFGVYLFKDRTIHLSFHQFNHTYTGVE